MEDGGIKTCPFCQEKIRASAIKCRYCGEFLQEQSSSANDSWIDIEGSFISATDPEPEPVPIFTREFVARHWRGDFPLAVSFGLIAVLLTICLSFVAAVATPLFRDRSLSEISFATLGIYLFIAALLPWQIAGAWRSLTQRGTKTLRTRAAAGCLVVITIGGAYLFLFKMIPQIAELAILKWENATLPPFELRKMLKDSEVEFRGGLRAGAATRLRQVLDQLPEVKVIELNSPGGRMDEARAIAQLIEERHLSVRAGEQCLGAAALVFLAANERAAEKEGQLGFERVDGHPLTGARRAQFEKLALDLFREAGVKKEFATRALSSRRGETWFPTLSELQLAGVITGTNSACSSAADDEPEDENQPWISRPLFSALKILDRSVYVRMLDEVYAGLQQNKSHAEMTSTLRALAAPVASRQIPNASTEAILAMRDYWIEALDTLGKSDPAICLALVSASSFTNPPSLKTVSYRLQKRGLEVIEKVLTDAVLPGQKYDGEDFQPGIGAADRWRENPRESCDRLRVLLREIANLSRERQVRILRSIFASESPN